MEALKDRLENLLARLDHFMEQKSSRERLIILLLPALLFFFVALNYLVPFAQKEHLKIERKLTQINNDIAEYRGRISAHTDGGRNYIQGLEGANLSLKEMVADTKDTNRYLDAKLQGLDFLIFNASGWSQYLHTLTGYATKNKISLHHLDNARVSDEANASSFSEVLRVDLNTSGSYERISRFITDIESDPTLSQIDYLEITGGSTLKANFNITLWGVRP